MGGDVPVAIVTGSGRQVGSESGASMLEAIERCESIAGRKLNWSLGEASGIDEILREIYEHDAESWTARV